MIYNQSEAACIALVVAVAAERGTILFLENTYV